MAGRLTEITVVDKGVHELQQGEMTLYSINHCWYIGCPGCKGFGNLGNHTVTESNGIITVSPSILCGCGAHYFIEDNKIRWC